MSTPQLSEQARETARHEPASAGGPPRLTLASRVALDTLALVAAVGVAFLLRFGLHWLAFEDVPLTFGPHMAAAALWILGVLGAMATYRLYDEDTLVRGGGELNRVRRALIEGFAFVGVAVFLFQLFSISRGWFLFVLVFSLVFLWTERVAYRGVLTRARASGKLRRAAVFVSASDEVLAEVGDSVDEFEVVARVHPDAFDTVPVQRRALVVIIDGTGISHDDFWALVLEAGRRGSAVFVRSPVREVAPDRLTTRLLGNETIVKVSPPSFSGYRAIVKRSIDLVVAVPVMVVMLLPMGVIAAAIVMTSGRPVLNVQTRIGRDGRAFRMLKFRTMRTDMSEATPTWSGGSDPRRTKLGKGLRRFSLDELPQLLNVVVGQMSIVGPRPEQEVYVERFNVDVPWYAFRERIRPGLTGLAQVRGFRGDTALEPRIAADNWYIEHWSLALDLKIMLLTLIEVFRGRGAA